MSEPDEQQPNVPPPEELVNPEDPGELPGDASRLHDDPSYGLLPGDEVEAENVQGDYVEPDDGKQDPEADPDVEPDDDPVTDIDEEEPEEH